MTNFERIKYMTEKEIAEKILIGISKDVCDYCPKCDRHCRNMSDMDIIIEYLKRDEKAWLKSDLK